MNEFGLLRVKEKTPTEKSHPAPASQHSLTGKYHSHQKGKKLKVKFRAHLDQISLSS